jgi:hypothetical protein
MLWLESTSLQALLGLSHRWLFLPDTSQTQDTMTTWQEAAGETPIPLIRYAPFQEDKGVYSLGEKNPADKHSVQTGMLSLDIRQHAELLWTEQGIQN